MISGDNFCEECSEMYGIGTAPSWTKLPSYSYSQGHDSGGKVSFFTLSEKALNPL